MCELYKLNCYLKKLSHFTLFYSPRCISFRIYKQHRVKKDKELQQRERRQRKCPSPSDALTPSYLRQWHTGNGSGRSSLCCSSPRWRLPPGSGNISEREGVTPVSTAHSAPPHAAPAPARQTPARVPVVTGACGDRMGGQFLTPLTAPPGGGAAVRTEGVRTEGASQINNRVGELRHAGPLVPQSTSHSSPELRADLACFFLLGTSWAEGEGKVVELYI